MAGTGQGDETRLASLRERAVLATGMSVTITDSNQQDNPLIWVNAAFTETTGYAFDEVVGRNCRFLQGPETDRRATAEIRESLAGGRPVTTTLLNYRKDGSPFWNELTITPVRDGYGAITHFVGVQADVTARMEAQQARDEALSQVARAADRLALLADFTARMALSRQPQQIVALLSSVLVPRLATWCLVYTLDDSGRLAVPHIRHAGADAEAGVQALVDDLRHLVPGQLRDASPIHRVLRGEQREVLITDYDAEPSQVSGAFDDERTALLRKLGTRSVVVVPLLSRDAILGCVAVVNDDSRPPFGADELALVRDLASRAGLMLENTQLYARERAAVETLQRSLLPRLPLIPGIDIAASYVPAADEAAVGGDWYDVFAVRGGGVGVVVGDVMGHDYDSAARMGKLSTIVRCYGWPGGDPYTVLTAVDELLEGSRQDILATALYAKLALHERGATLRYSSAGHPPVVVRDPDGSAHTLDGGRGPMIGVSRLMPAGSQRPGDAVVELARGATLICFTDGLIDAFSDEPDLDAGLAEVRRATSALPVGAGPQVIVDALTGSARQHTDDVAVVAIRIA